MNPEVLDQLPPNDLNAESGVLGSMLLDPDVCDDVAVLLRAEDFYAPANADLFRNMMALHTEGKGRLDPTRLITRLKKTKTGPKSTLLESVGGEAYISDVFKYVPSSANAMYYAETVAEKSMLRGIIHASSDSLREAYQPDGDAKAIAGAAERRLFGVLERGVSSKGVSMQDVLASALDRVDKRSNGLGQSGHASGFADFDAKTGGLVPGELLILAARPSMGKSALAANIAVKVSQARPVLFVSLEMSAGELGERILSAEAQVDFGKMRNGRTTADDCRELMEANARLCDHQLTVVDDPGMTLLEISAIARRMKRKGELGLVVIDYLQLIEPDDRRTPREQQVAAMSRGLKNLARQLPAPVLCLAQLNRQADAAGNNRPRLSHLRESGAIEQDADVVLFVHREEYFATTEDARLKVQGKAELIVAKNRNGPTGDVPLVWQAEYLRFLQGVRDGEQEPRVTKYDFRY